MKFFTAIVALAGLSSTHATLRGVLPADMKELLHNKFVASGHHDACNAYISAYHSCDPDAEDSCTDAPQDCNIICDWVLASNNDNISENGYYCVQGSGMEEDVEEEEKELLHNKFVASGDSGDVDACNAYISAYHSCTNTDSDGTQTKGSCTDAPQDCNIICDWVLASNSDNISENGYYCVQGSGMEEDVEEEEKEEDMVATTCDICTALNTNAISCESTPQCVQSYKHVNAEHCSVTCSWVLASNSDNISEDGKYCVQGSGMEEDVDTTN
eukprot:scaffold1160_cov120-Skeletonema_menzelii.AAC.10